MKIFTKISAILAIVVLSLFSTLKAQTYQIPNSGFEDFVPDNNNSNTGYRPVGWYSSNVHTTALGITARRAVVHPGSLTGVNMSDAWNQPTSNGNNPILPHVAVQGRNGTECVYIHNEMAGALGIESDSYAYISLGKPWNQVDGALIPDAQTARGGCEGGIDFTHRPDTMEVWIKRSWQIQENARLLIYLWAGEFKGTHYRSMSRGCLPSNRTNDEVDVRGTNSCTTTQRGTLVGEGQWVSTQQFSDWTLIKVPIRYFSNLPPEKVNIFISAANYPDEGNTQSVKAGARLWADDLRLIYSSKIHDIRVDVNGTFRPIPNVNKNVYDYTYVVREGVNFTPAIQAFRSGRQLLGSEITVVDGVIDGNPTVITVRAEDDPNNTTTYRVHFVRTQSTNASPANILVNGSPISNFNPNITTYNIALPYGTTTCPTIDIHRAEGAQTFTTSNCTTIPSSIQVTVFAQDISVSRTYTLNFTVAQLNDNTLQDIKINGVSIPNFRPTVNNYYNVELPLGTTQDPLIEPVSAYEDGEQTIVMNDGGLSGTTTIQVSSPASNVRTYRITFVVVASSYAYLDDIKVGGVTIPNFDSETFVYNYQLPRGTETLPAITWTLGEQNQTVSITYGGVNGETRIMVTAQNGTTKIYRINFSVARSEISTLNDIKVGGISVTDFNPYILEYDVELPSGTTELPEITYLLGDVAQTVRVTTNGVNGTTTIRVNAENPQFFLIYRLNFSVALSENSQLNDILINGFSLEGFSPEILNYNYILPSNAAQCPNISVVKGTAGQQVFITKPALTGVATIRVISEIAGGGENIYTINFQFDFQLSSNNFLDSIKLDGELLAGFNNTTTSYLVELQPNTPAPAVEYFKSDNTSNVFMIDNGLNGVQIEVTAQNGATRTYSIAYTIAQTNNVDLANIEIWDNENFVSLADFDAQVVEYQYPLSWRTNPVPAIHPVAAESGQVITIFYNKVNHTTEIQVVASNGIDQKTYKVHFPVDKSDNCALSLITVDGWEIQDLSPVAFDPQVLNYNITLPYGTTQTPIVAFEKGKDGDIVVFEQQIEVTAGSISEPYKLKVIAEDGTTQTYTLNFSVDMSEKSGENYLENILVNNIPVENFDSETSEYSVVLPYGTTELPDISFVKKYPEQTIAMDLGGVWGASKINVYSNISGVDPTEYTINFSVYDIPNLKLDSILFDDVKFENFDPRVNSYIVPVTSVATPRVEYFYDYSTLYVNEDVTFDPSHHKKLVLEVINQEETESNIYTFWYFYTNDTLPNPSFEEWGPAEYNSTRNNINAVSPTGWNTPADCVESVSRLLATTYYFGLEVQQSEEGDATDGDYSALIHGAYSGTITQKFIPGILTLGNFVSTGNNTGNNHNTSVNGGVNFRNTPDVFNFDYKWTKDDGSTNNNMRAVVQLWNAGDNYTAAQGVANSLYTGTSEEWLSVSQPITYTDFFPKRLNIILNSTDSENAVTRPTSITAAAAATLKWGRLWADNVSFGYSSILNNIYVDGVAVPAFDGNDNATQYSMSFSTVMPVITFDNQVPDQEVRVTMTDEINRQRTVTLDVKAEDSSTTQYTLVITRSIAEVDTLAGIIVDGVAIADFAADNFEYNVIVPNGTLYSPDILAIKGEGHQTISYVFGNKQVSIIVTAEDEIAQQTYIVNFVEATSDDATLANLEVEGYESAFVFDAQTTEYQVALSVGTQDIPNILFTKQSDGQTVILTTSSVNDTTTIRVEAEDKINFTDYKVIFSRPAETSSFLREISIESLPISDFDKENFEYTVDFGKIIFTREFAENAKNVVYNSDSIECFVGENRYLVTFGISNGDNAYLADILINGVSISSYQQTQFIYTENFDGEILPNVSAVSGAEGQTIVYTWGENLVTISVTAQDGLTQNEYVVNFVPSVMSSNALLANILINNVSIDNFLATTFDYTLELSEYATVIPVIQAIKGEDNQTIFVTTNGVNGLTTILVTAQDGSQATYTIDFTVALSSNALLAEIFVDGELIANFSSQRFYYEYELPYNTQTLPNVAYTQAHPNQIVQVQPNGVNGNYIITVTSENGLVQNQYIIAFRTALSANAYLVNILANGVGIPNFEYDEVEHKVEVPCGTTEVPTITWTMQVGQNQVVVPTYAQTFNDTTFLLVTSENGVYQHLYKIYFEVKQSSNVLLADIIIGGESLKAIANGYITDNLFDAEWSEYNITLPYGTTELPTVSAVGQGSENCFEIEIETIGNVVNIDVISQDGSINSYDLYFTVALSDNSQLLDISLRGTSIIDNFTFNNGTFEYHIQYPVNSDLSVLATDADITYEIGEEHQTVTVELEEDGTTINITVTAQDGSQTPYVITQKIIEANNALLRDILIDGKSLSGFNPMNFYYEYTLELGATEIPTFEGVKQVESQTVECIGNNVGEISYIIVEAEDGSENVYRILFKESEENIGLEPKKNDVCWKFYGDGVLFSSKKNNVSVMVFDINGQLVYKADIPVAESNAEDICKAETGATFTGQKGRTYAFTFIYNGKKRIQGTSGKFAF